MHSILLAAGQGVRLRPLTSDRPKALLVAAGRPMLADLLDELDSPVTLVVGHGALPVQNYVANGERWNLSIAYTKQDVSLGPGHALAQAAPDEEEILVLPGDSWYHPDLIQRLKDTSGPAMIQVPDARSGRHGVPVVEDGKVTQLLELEQAGDRATGFCGGAYKVNRRIFEYLEQCNFSMRDAIRMDLQKNGPWNLVKAKAREYVDVIEVQDLLKVHGILMSDMEPVNQGTIAEGAIVSGAVHIEEGSIIHAGAIVQGPVHIGKNCDIGPGAVLLPGTAIRNRVRIEPMTLLARCSIASNVTIGSHGRIHDAVIDNGATLGSYVHIESSTGTIIGADAQLGDHVTVQRGGVVGRNSQVASGRTVHTVPDNGQAV